MKTSPSPLLPDAPGQYDELTPNQADALGAFEETAIDAQDAQECAELPSEHWPDAFSGWAN